MENIYGCSKFEIFIMIDTHLLHDERPSEFLNQLSQDHVFSEHPFDILGTQKTTDQQREHHPEGSVWNHTLLVVDEAAKQY